MSNVKGSIRIDDYKGNRTIVLGDSTNPRDNWGFGKRKINLLLDAIDVHGIDAVMAMFSSVAGRMPASVKVGLASTNVDACTVATPIVAPGKAEPSTVVSGMISVAKSADMSRSDMIDYLVNRTDWSVAELALCSDVELRATAQDVMGKTSNTDTPTVATDDSAEKDRLIGILRSHGTKGNLASWKLDTLRAKVDTLPNTPPVATDDTAERAELIQRLKDAGTKGNLATWKIETLRSKVAALPTSKQEAPKADVKPDTPTPVLSPEMRTQALRYNVEGSRVVDVAVVGTLILALLANGRTFEVKGDASRPRFYPTNETFKASQPNGKATTVAEVNGDKAPAAPHIIHREFVDGLPYALFSNGVTKRIRLVDDKATYLDTDVKIVEPVKTPSKTVWKVYKDGATETVCYTDGTYVNVPIGK